ncbi:MAG: ribosomal protein S18-alanine N-acetyltransferase [Archaeoglobaceae archaeon]
MLSIMIRSYKPTDFQDIVTIEREAFAPKNPAYDVFMYISHGDDFLVVEMSGKVIGFVSIMDAGVDARIMSIAVKNEFRRQGIGTILIERAIEKCKEKGKLRVLLEVRTTNYDAQILYKKKGFKAISTIPFYYNDGGDAYLMELDLAGQ